MRRLLAALLLCAAASAPALADSDTKAPAFAAADIHTSPHRNNPLNNGAIVQGDRFVWHQATMLDLVSWAYSLDASQVQGGPAWLEMHRFDIIAKIEPGTPDAQLRLMLRALLAERFGVVMHEAMKPMPAWVLSVAKGGVKLKDAQGTGEGSCDGDDAAPKDTPFVNYIKCSTMTMSAFAPQLQGIAGGYFNNSPVVDETGLEKAYDFRFHFTGRAQIARAGADAVTIFDAMEQLGLKLELKTAPRKVQLIESVNETPTPNPAGWEKVLPPQPPPAFDVVVIKPSKADEQPNGNVNGGQVATTALSLRFLLTFAWDLNPNDTENIANAPKWLDSDKWDILAKAVMEAPAANGRQQPGIDLEDLREMMKALLAERFGLRAHLEDRQIPAYTLYSVAPKLRDADPNSRTRCFEGPGPDGKDPRIANPHLNRLLTCQNMSTAQICDELQRVAGGYIYTGVKDSTGLTGRYDFTLSFTAIGLLNAQPTGDSSDPNGAMSLYDAVKKELGLKLEKEKRPAPVLVIDHLDEKPTEN